MCVELLCKFRKGWIHAGIPDECEECEGWIVVKKLSYSTASDNLARERVKVSQFDVLAVTLRGFQFIHAGKDNKVDGSWRDLTNR